MSIKSLNPYLIFNGNAAKAIQFYETALGAKSEGHMKFGDIPNHQCADEDKERVMHARLRLGEGLIMLSDSQPGRQVPREGNCQVALHFDDAADMTQKFNALAEGGQITMPLNDTFWGARFGMLTDVFGIRWMFNCEQKKS